jgi:hypothetical protein
MLAIWWTRHKPKAFYILELSAINYDWASMKKSFTPRIVREVQKTPF